MKIATGGIGAVATSALASSPNVGRLVDKGTIRVGNKIPYGYSNFEGHTSDFGLSPITIPPDTQGIGFTYPNAKYKFEWDDNTVQDHAMVIVDRDSGLGVNGPHTLKVVMRPRGISGPGPNTNRDWIRFGEESFGGKEVNLDYIFEIPAGKLWEFSYYLRANTAIDVGVSQTFYCGNNTHFPIGSYFGRDGFDGDWQTVDDADTWTKKTLLVDLRSIDCRYGQATPVRPGGGTAAPAGKPFGWVKNSTVEGGVNHPHADFNYARLYTLTNSYSNNFSTQLFSNSTYTTPPINASFHGSNHPQLGLEWTANADVLLLNPGDTTRVGITLFTNASSTQGIEYHFDDFTFIEHEDQDLNTTGLGEIT
ncbi:MAG: hypothetical protein GY751_23030 [Bacteroidetes bacterium]|nr:hypothetical protein [Bacteroidota bacterium]